MFEEEISEDIVVTKEFLKGLIRDRNILQALENAGVDNWEGYDIAMEEALTE